MLWFIREWLEQNLTDEDSIPQLDYYEVRDWGNEQERLNGAQALYLFKQLVEEDYIAVTSMNTQINELPWDVAWPQALTTKGLLEIGELPDSNARLLPWKNWLIGPAYISPAPTTPIPSTRSWQLAA